jgi:hypothetical protein
LIPGKGGGSIYEVESDDNDYNADVGRVSFRRQKEVDRKSVLRLMGYVKQEAVPSLNMLSKIID